jgi:hypothetical protein
VVIVVDESSIIITWCDIIWTIVGSVVIYEISSDRIIRDQGSIYIELTIRDLEQVIGIVVIDSRCCSCELS